MDSWMVMSCDGSSVQDLMQTVPTERSADVCWFGL